MHNYFDNFTSTTRVRQLLSHSSGRSEVVEICAFLLAFIFKGGGRTDG